MLNMPEMSGIVQYCSLTAVVYNIPTILVTGYPNAGVRKRALADGVVCYLPKPINENDLIGCIRTVLARQTE